MPRANQLHCHVACLAKVQFRSGRTGEKGANKSCRYEKGNKASKDHCFGWNEMATGLVTTLSNPAREELRGSSAAR